jgi:hypothetical protein
MMLYNVVELKTIQCNFTWTSFASAGGLFVPEGIIRPVVSASVLTWFIRYIFYRNLQLLIHVILIKTKALLPQA